MCWNVRVCLCSLRNSFIFCRGNFAFKKRPIFTVFFKLVSQKWSDWLKNWYGWSLGVDLKSHHGDFQNLHFSRFYGSRKLPKLPFLPPRVAMTAHKITKKIKYQKSLWWIFHKPPKDHAYQFLDWSEHFPETRSKKSVKKQILRKRPF